MCFYHNKTTMDQSRVQPKAMFMVGRLEFLSLFVAYFQHILYHKLISFCIYICEHAVPKIATLEYCERPKRMSSNQSRRWSQSTLSCAWWWWDLQLCCVGVSTCDVFKTVCRFSSKMRWVMMYKKWLWNLCVEKVLLKYLLYFKINKYYRIRNHLYKILK